VNQELWFEQAVKRWWRKHEKQREREMDLNEAVWQPDAVTQQLRSITEPQNDALPNIR
jgi:hypothetical protein